MELWNGIIQTVNMFVGLANLLVVIAGFVFAIRSVNSWREELKGKKKLEFYEETYATLKLIENGCPFIFRTFTTEHEMNMIKRDIPNNSKYHVVEDYMSQIDYRLTHTYLKNYNDLQSRLYKAILYLPKEHQELYYELINIFPLFVIEHSNDTKEEVEAFGKALQAKIKNTTDYLFDELTK